MTANEALTISHDSDLATLDKAYSVLNSAGDDGGAFPGSKVWRACKPYNDALYALITARPDLEPYRRELATAERRKALEGVDVLGL